MQKLQVSLLVLLVAVMSGCAMFSAWKSIPPPGGCDRCHTLPIGSNWQVAYQAPMLTNERHTDRPYFQTGDYTMPQPDKPSSSLDIQKMEEQRCFDCHRSPSPAHRERAGRYHHW